jgi:hypothetical protein
MHALHSPTFRAKYVEAMRSRRTAREKAHLVRKVDDLDVDLGLDR